MISLEEYKQRHVTVVVEEQHGLEVIEGPRGERGEKGDKGDPGESNIPGPQGERGEKGEPGEQGPAGKDGVDGKDGLPGRDGIDGKDGIQGPKGDKGEQGIQGPKGETGEQGLQGLPGKDGANGTNGKDGLPGVAGPKGDTGATGAQGIQGVAGPKGDAGAQGPAGVGIKGFAAGYVDAGQFVTLDNMKFTVTTGGQRGLTVAAVTGTLNLMISGTFGYISGVGGSATNQAYTYTTTPNMTGSWFGWSFPNQGDGSVYLVNDVTNYRFYRVTLMIGPGYTKNFISIERLY